MGIVLLLYLSKVDYCTAQGFGWNFPYSIAQFVGAAAASGAFRFVRATEFGIEAPEGSQMKLLMSV